MDSTQTVEQESMFPVPKPQAEHHWLDRLVGVWIAEPDQGASPAHEPWTETVRSIGGLWVELEGRGQMPGVGDATTVMTLGFNPPSGRFVGSFIGSMMTHFWVYDGSLESDSLVLYADGPDMKVKGKIVKYRDTLTFTDTGHRMLRSEIQGDDGGWTEIMLARYTRKK